MSLWKPGLVAALLALAACGSKSDNEATQAPAPPPTGMAPAAAVVAAPSAPAPSLSDLPAPYNAANLENGAMIFVKCRNCHSTVPADGNKTGPNLHGVFRRHPGTAAAFKYSDAMAANPHEKWTPAELEKWLSKPKDYLPGTKMFFNGVDSPDDRRDVIAYLLIEAEK